jgi:hypothetical protein
LKIVRSTSLGKVHFRVYPATASAPALLKDLVRDLESQHLPFVVGARENDQDLLLSVGPLDESQAAAFLARWGEFTPHSSRSGADGTN